MIIAIGVIVLFLAFRFWISAHAIKGRGGLGERRVAKQLNKLPNDDYIIFNDVLIKTSRGTSQIDHVVVGVTEDRCHVRIDGAAEADGGADATVGIEVIAVDRQGCPSGDAAVGGGLEVIAGTQEHCGGGLDDPGGQEVEVLVVDRVTGIGHGQGDAAGG